MSTQALLKVANYRLDDSEKFNDENFYEFLGSFKFLLMLNNLSYLIEKDSNGNDKDGPPGSNRITDMKLLFSVLRMNISKTACRLIGPYAAEQDGVKAWEAYQTRDIGSLVGLLGIKRQMVWNGGDEESFDEFIGGYLDIVTKLESHGWTSTDYMLTGDLLERVPIEYIIQNPSIDLKNPESLTFAHMKEAIKSNIRLMQNKSSTAAFFAKANSNSNNNNNQQNRNHNQKNNSFNNNNVGSNSQKVTTPCGICKLMGVPDEKAMHPEKNCWNEKRFPDLVKMLKDQKRNNNKKESAGFENSFAHLAVKDSDDEEEEACFMASEIVGGYLPPMTWVIDTGCTVSLTPHCHHLVNYVKVHNQFVTVGNKQQVSVEGIGELVFKGKHGKTYRVKRILHAPGIACNLLSVRVFTDAGAEFVAKKGTGKIFTSKGSTILEATLQKNLLRCNITPILGVSHCQSFDTCLLTKAALFHRRFGHVSVLKMDGMPEARDDRCEPCVMGKFKRVPFNLQRPEISIPLEEISIDLFGPSRVKTAAGMTYMMVTTDAATSHTCIYFLQSKKDAFNKLKQYQAFIEKQSSFKIRRIRSDGGGEFDNGLMSGWCKQLGIMHVMNAPYSSTQNAIAERRIGIILNDTRTLLLDSHLPLPLWGYDAAHAVYIRNRLPSKEGSKSSHQLMFKRKPRLDHLRPFGCAAFTWLPDRHREDGKLNARAEKLVLVGFEESSSNARLYNLEEETFLKSRDVRYFEDVYPARGDKIPDLSFLRAQWETSRDKHLTHQGDLNNSRDKHLSEPVGDHKKHANQNMWSDDGEVVEVANPDPPEEERSASPEEDQRPPQQHNGMRQPSREPSRSPIVTRSRDRAAAMRQRAAELRQSRQISPPPAPDPPQGTIIHEDLDVLDSDGKILSDVFNWYSFQQIYSRHIICACPSMTLKLGDDVEISSNEFIKRFLIASIPNHLSLDTK